MILLCVISVFVGVVIVVCEWFLIASPTLALVNNNNIIYVVCVQVYMVIPTLVRKPQSELLSCLLCGDREKKYI